MKLFICDNERMLIALTQRTNFADSYLVADKIDEFRLDSDPDPSGYGYTIRGTLDNGNNFCIRLGRLPSSREAERAFRELRALIGKHSTNEPGDATIAFNGTQWNYR